MVPKPWIRDTCVSDGGCQHQIHVLNQDLPHHIPLTIMSWENTFRRFQTDHASLFPIHKMFEIKIKLESPCWKRLHEFYQEYVKFKSRTNILDLLF